MEFEIEKLLKKDETGEIMKYSKKCTLPLLIMTATIINSGFYTANADSLLNVKESPALVSTENRKSNIDVTTGWHITNYSSSQGIT
ncbi:hypothetical protein, partial [Lactococcus garvieae]|uniref:hypothetical protein n=1 Tax=Lactococcus garvieae TaxID=1363 RepID=UPI0022E58FC6